MAAYNPYNPGYTNQGYTAPTTNTASSAGPTITPASQTASPTVAAPSTSGTLPQSTILAQLKKWTTPAVTTVSTTTPKTPAPKTALDKWLAGDTDYQQQVAEFNQQQQSYEQQYNDSINQQNQNYNSTKTGMDTQAATDRQNQQYDFAGRGVLQSGVYAQALDQYNTTFNQNMNNLTQGNTQALGSDQDQLNNFLRELTLQKNAAKQDAIRRRAETLGI